MQYRLMPRSEDLISALGFGCMRFPTTKDGKIDEDKAIQMLIYARDNGVNYFDTAWPYHNGESELFVGSFVASSNRNDLLLATKLPCWLVKTRQDMDNYLDNQLKRLNSDYIDYYLLHALNQKSWAEMKKLGVLDFLEQAKRDGRIRYAGFSFHDAYPLFKKISLAWEWDFCQIMLNYFDTHYQAGMNGYRLAMERGMGIISMEPLRGGKLVSPIPPEVSAVWAKSKVPGSYLEKALRWVWDLPGCTVCLSGMSSLEQVQQNIALSEVCAPDSIDQKEKKLYVEARRAYIKRIAVNCSECRYCLPCPHQVAIPGVFGMYNEAKMFDDRDRHTREYNMFIPDDNKASQCVNCGVCVPQCPQHIDIPSRMAEIKEYFGK